MEVLAKLYFKPINIPSGTYVNQIFNQPIFIKADQNISFIDCTFLYPNDRVYCTVDHYGFLILTNETKLLKPFGVRVDVFGSNGGSNYVVTVEKGASVEFDKCTIYNAGVATV